MTEQSREEIMAKLEAEKSWPLLSVEVRLMAELFCDIREKLTLISASLAEIAGSP